MIYKLLGGTPQDSLNGTTVLDTVALMKGANILRVHDVREAVEAVRIVDKLRTESEYGNDRMALSVGDTLLSFVN